MMAIMLCYCLHSLSLPKCMSQAISTRSFSWRKSPHFLISYFSLTRGELGTFRQQRPVLGIFRYFVFFPSLGYHERLWKLYLLLSLMYGFRTGKVRHIIKWQFAGWWLWLFYGILPGVLVQTWPRFLRPSWLSPEIKIASAQLRDFMLYRTESLL